jgi:hypothetical protein
MQHNCEQLASHLKSILCLSTMASNQQRVSIDGSLEDDSAIVSVSIVAPDIRILDNNMEWQSRPAKVLLIRAWKLTKRWGTSSTCINMAEVLGFIFGKYTIPPNSPIICITDSKNARALQCNILHKNNLTHRTMIQKIKQGLDYSLANHLEHLTYLWMGLEYLDNQDQECYLRGKNICRLWATNWHKVNHVNEDLDDEEQLEYESSWSSTSSFSLSSTCTSYDLSPAKEKTKNSRSTFDDSMYDCLGKILIVKVFLHQMHSDFTVKNAEKGPSPNTFVASANQIADNATSMAQQLYNQCMMRD